MPWARPSSRPPFVVPMPASPIDPALALGLFVLLVLGSVALWAPRRGLWWRLRRAFRSTERVRIEDALKHLYVAEYGGHTVSTGSLAGNMEVPRATAARTLQLLTERGLASLRNDVPTLTPDGREYAVRVLRSHRLWERYLADRTGVKPDDWHSAAEEEEHEIDSARAEALASRLGHPRYDPHGDPIPTVDGELPPPRGIPLSTVEAGASVEVTHIEDEPAEVFERIHGAGLFPHMRFNVDQRDEERLRIRVAGRPVQLPTVVASNVTVRLLGPHEVVAAPSGTLADLRPGESGRVRGISPRCQGPQRRRLLDLGVVPGTEIRAELSSAGGDPMAYDIRGALIALRHEQASWVQIEGDGEEHAAASSPATSAVGA